MSNHVHLLCLKSLSLVILLFGRARSILSSKKKKKKKKKEITNMDRKMPEMIRIFLEFEMFS